MVGGGRIKDFLAVSHPLPAKVRGTMDRSVEELLAFVASAEAFEKVEVVIQRTDNGGTRCQVRITEKQPCPRTVQRIFAGQGGFGPADAAGMSARRILEIVANVARDAWEQGYGPDNDHGLMAPPAGFKVKP